MLCVSCSSKPADPPPPAKVHTSYRVLGGISMGAIGTAAFGLKHPERFDALVALGGPLDAPLMLRTIDRFHLGGFCPREQLLGSLATLNDPKTAHCDTHPAPIRYEHVQDFNHWQFTTNTPFDRSGYVDLFTDLTLAYGNLLTENPASTFAPTGVPDAFARNPPADFCTNPVRVKGLKNREYNPDGSVDAITFCDGEPVTYFCNANEELVDFCSDPANLVTPLPRAAEAAFAATYCSTKGGSDTGDRVKTPAIMLRAGGRYDPCREAKVPVLVALAWDFNGNGKRDFGEPIVNNGEERYRDTGTDGCANTREDGAGGCRTTDDPAALDPNHDDYDADANPLGTENNWRHDDGEPFDDDGLDGVAGTADFGEGNGSFDVTHGRAQMYANDPRSLLKKLPAASIARFNFVFDGGIRDLFNFGLTAHQVYGLWKTLRPADTEQYRDWTQIPGMADSRTGAFRPWGGPWTRKPPHNFEVLYGKETPTLDERLTGDGDHVGSNSQAIYRLATLYNVTAAQWPSLPRPSTPLGGLPYDDRERIEWFQSAALGAKRGYGIFLPPGYDAPENAEVRYPVLFLLHGYTGTPKQILPSAFLADTFMKDTDVKLRPMIVVVPSGACCWVNGAQKDCREEDDAKVAFEGRTGWRRECRGGNFFVNQTGASKYEDSFLELMSEVDSKFRTLPSAEVEQR